MSILIPSRVRYVVLVLLALAPFCAYLTRNLSAANTTIGEEFQVDPKAMGDIISGFALGYFFFQVPGGILASWLGVRLVLPALGVAWCGCALWGSVAGSAHELWLSRVAMGFAQAGLVPCCAKVVADWFPLDRRGIVSSVLTGSMQLGAVVATALTAALLAPLGWRLVLAGYAVVGIVWSLVYFGLFRNRPEQHAGVNDAELELIEAGKFLRRVRSVSEGIGANGAAPPVAKGWLVLSRFALSVSVWAYFVQAFFRAYAAEFFYTWCPAYLEKGFDLKKDEAGVLAMFPVIALGGGSIVAGFLVDVLLRTTGNRWISRSGAAAFGMAACAVCFTLLTQIHQPTVVVVLLSLAALFLSLGGPATWAAGMDLGGRYTAVVVGAMNMVGNVGAYLSPRHVGTLFGEATRGASLEVVPWLLAGISWASAAAWLFVNPNRTIAE